ncbi:MAG: tetratricopeptide repeat protein [Dehalococcoidia bacterium]
MLIAPAGYGKTTLVSQFAASMEVPVLWCVFKPEDAGAEPFARKVFQVIELELSGVESKGSGTTFINVEPRKQLRAAVTELAAVSSSTYCILVLEDYHHVTASEEVDELTGEILENLPAEIHLIITSRVWPEIKQLPKVVAQQKISVLEEGDLAFTRGEVADLLRLMTEASPVDEEVRELFEVTAGWPACVVLLGASGIPYGALSRKSPTLYGYFAAEILNGLPARIARFMLETSVLPFLTPSYCNEVLKRSDAAVIMERLRARRLIQPSLGQRDAYEYHPLPREFLLSRLRGGSPQRYEQLHIQAADLFRRHGRWHESVQLLTAIEAWSQLADLLEELAPILFRRGMWNVLSEWIDRLPNELLFARTQLVLFKSKLAYFRGDFSKALQLLASRQEILVSPQGLTIRAAVLTFQGQYTQAIRLARQGLNLAREASHSEAAADARLFLGVAQIMKGSYPSAERSLRGALRHFLGVGDMHGQALCYMQLAGMYHFQGRVQEETALLESAERLWRKLGNSEQLAGTLNNLGVSHHIRGNHEPALLAFTDCLEVTQRFGITVTQAYCLIGLADLFRDQLKLGRAERLYKQGISLAKDLGERVLYIYALAGQADLKRLEGDLDASQAIAEQALIEAIDHHSPKEEGVCLTVLGSVYRDQGRLCDATAILERACQLLEQTSNRIDAAKANLLLASSLFRARQRSRALNHLERVANIIRIVGHDQFIVPLVREERPLIQYALAKYHRRGPFLKWLGLVAADVRRKAIGVRSTVRMPTVEIWALGGFTVRINDISVSDLAWETTKAKEMFLYLVVKRKPSLKAEILEALWPDLPSTKCNSYFHSNLHRIRQAVYPGCLVSDGPRYSLNPEGVFKSDVNDFLDSVEFCRKGEASIEALRRAASLYSGPFAPEVYSDWATALRAQLEDHYLWVLDRLLAHELHSGNQVEIVTLCEKILDVDPFHEVAWQEIIRYHRDEGRLGLSLRLYRRCTDAFVGQLGIELPTAIGDLMRSA